MITEENKEIYINKTVRLVKSSEGFWTDSDGVIYALPDKASSVDETVRCGIGILSLPESWKVNQACKVHDYAYSSPVYQAYYSRKQADLALKKQFESYNMPLVGKLFYRLSRLFGGKYWENNSTK